MYLFDSIFMELVNMTFTASWLILAIILFRLIFRKCPKWINCLLWLLVGIRLVCPVSFESEMSLVPQKDVITDENFYYSFAPTIDSGINIIDNAVNPVISDVLSTEPVSSVNNSQIFGFLMGVVWFIGLCSMLLYALISYIRLKKQVRTAIPFKDNILICDEVSSPFILGFIRPKIYMPSTLSESNAQYVISHERAHLRRKDYLWKPLGFIILSVYWFNPLVWISYIMLCRDIELACDEKVLKEKGEKEKKAYSEALFSCSAKQKYITACPVAFGEVGVKQRIKAVLNYKKPAFWVILIALIASIVVGVCFMTDPKDDDYILKLDEYEISSQDIKFYAFVSDGEYFYQAYDEESIRLTNKILSEVDITARVLYNLVDPSKERISKHSLVAVPNEGDSVFLYFDENFETMWCCDVDGNYSGIYSFSGGEKVKALFEDKSFINEEAVWTCNPMLSATWHYQLKFTVGEEIVGATCSMGEIEISEDKKSFIWTPDVVTNPSDIRENAYFEVTAKTSSEEHKYNFTLEAIGWEENLSVTYYRAVESDTTGVAKTSYGNYKVSQKESSDTANVSASLDAAVSKAILDINGQYNWLGECAAEGHIIFTTKEKGDKVTVYLIEEYYSFGFENGYFMSMGGHRIPAVMTFEKTDEGYSFLDVEYAKDGSEYTSSIKKMFPKAYESRALSATEEDNENMWKQCVAYAEKYLKEIGREAEICTYGDIDHVLLTDLGVSVDVSNKLSELAINYNTGEVGYFEKIENGVRYVYRTSYLQNENVILYTKEVYGTNEVVERIEIDSLTGNVIGTTSYTSLSLEGKYIKVKTTQTDGTLSAISEEDTEYYIIKEGSSYKLKGDYDVSITISEVTSVNVKIALSDVLVDYSLGYLDGNDVSDFKIYDEEEPFKLSAPVSGGTISYTFEIVDEMEENFSETTNPIIATDTYFDAKVLKVSENSVLVEPFEDSNERKSSDKIWVSTAVTSSVPVPDMYEDTYIRIFYDGMIEETYPAKIPHVSAIYLYADVNYIGSTAAHNEPTTQAYYVEPETTEDSADTNESESVGYIYESEKDTASLVLLPKEKKFTFMLSLFSSYLPVGTYEESGKYIILKTDDGNNTYTFKKKGENLIFLAGKSSAVPEYRYATGEKAVVCIPNKAKFTKGSSDDSIIENSTVEETKVLSKGKVSLLSKNIYDDSIFAEHYIIVNTGSATPVMALGGDYSINLSYYDVDGEEGEEIIVQQTTGATGGAGSYRSSVLKITDNEIKTIFSSDGLNPYNNGFSSKVEAPFTVKIINEFTDYELSLDYKDSEGYIGGVFDKKGYPIQDSGYDEVMFDSFYEFNPVDVDNDGVYELECLQYSSLYGHADYIGTAKSVLKYNSKTKSFKVIDAKFFPLVEIPDDFDISFTFGIELDNVYDTYNNTLKKDMVAEDDITVNFEPSDEDLSRIYAKILELDLTSIEKKMTSSVLTKTGTVTSVSPLNRYNIKITMNGETYYINGDATASYYKNESDEANRFCRFTEFMTELYYNTPEYKSLPEAVGAYS